jgi:predicted SAM-dependent methyltransferase
VETIQQGGRSWFPKAQPYDVELIKKIDLQQGNIAKLPYESGMFDVICCISVLEHTTTGVQFDAIQEAYRCLKAGGKYLVTVDYPDVNLEYIYSIADVCGFRYQRPDSLIPSREAIKSAFHGGINCYHFEFFK